MLSSSLGTVENLLKKVAEEAEQDLLLSLEQGYKQALEILEKAKSEADAETRKTSESKERQIETLRRRTLGKAELESRNRSLQLVEETVHKAFTEALTRLGGYSSKKYETALYDMLSEAADIVEAPQLRVACSSKDRSLMNKLMERLGKQRKIKLHLEDKPIDTAGGVRVTAFDGTVVYDNTVEARLERLKPVLRKRLADLFSKEG